MFTRDKKPKSTTPDQKQQEQLFFQPKLNFGKSGDKYEVEADNMADKIVNKTTTNAPIQKKNTEEVQQKPLASEVTPIVQKMEGGEEETVQQKMEEESIQKKCKDCEKEKKIQKMDEGIPTTEHGNYKKQQVSLLESKLRKGHGGQLMEANIRSEMEAGFGTDFSKVKIHKDSEASNMSASIGAQAFTHGHDIYFNKGKYNPNSKEGKHLLAHELTHTIQQNKKQHNTTTFVQKKEQKNDEDCAKKRKDFFNKMAQNIKKKWDNKIDCTTTNYLEAFFQLQDELDTKLTVYDQMRIGIQDCCTILYKYSLEKEIEETNDTREDILQPIEKQLELGEPIDIPPRENDFWKWNSPTNVPIDINDIPKTKKKEEDKKKEPVKKKEENKHPEVINDMYTDPCERFFNYEKEPSHFKNEYEEANTYTVFINLKGSKPIKLTLFEGYSKNLSECNI